jgi:hypothetical protein
MWTIRSAAFLTLAIVPAFAACNCVTRFSVCDEVRMSDVVFIGTVESLTNAKTLFESAKTQEDLKTLFKSYALQESSATLRIRTVFRRPGDFPDRDDDPAPRDVSKPSAKNDDDNHRRGAKTKAGQPSVPDKDKPHDPNNDLKEGGSVVIYTEPGDCGFNFQKGETYLVYAIEDEQDTRLETTACTRTARVSDAGQDLAYLYFLQNDPQSSRLEGFVTSEPKHLTPDRFQYTGRIDSPVAGIRLALESDHASVDTTSDRNGRFVFDGLTEGSYNVSAYPADETGHGRRLASSGTLRIEARSCKSTILLIPLSKPAPR